MKTVILACMLFLALSLMPSGAIASSNQTNVDSQLLELARDGRLTVRALRAWGLLDSRHHSQILELRNLQNLDVLAANSAQLDAWLDDAKAGKLNLSKDQQAGLAEIRVLIGQLQEVASSSPTGVEQTTSQVAVTPEGAGVPAKTDNDDELFGIVKANTQEATMKVLNYNKARDVFDLKTSTQLINDFVTTGHVEEEKGVIGNFVSFLNPIVGGIEAFTHIGTGGGAFAGAFGSFFGEFGANLSTNISTSAGYANLLIATVQTYDDVTTKGWQDKETGANAYKNIITNFSTLTSLLRGPYVTSARAYALNLGFAAVYVYGFTLDLMVDEAKNVRNETIQAAHKAYYSQGSNAYISDDEWYRIFASYYDKAMKNSSDPTQAFQDAYTGMQSTIEKYISGYWQHGENDIFTILEAKRRFNYDASSEEKEYLNTIAKHDLYTRLNQNTLPRIQRFMLTRFSEESANTLDKMCEPMNTRCRISVFESQPDEFKERTYANYTLRFAHVGNDGRIAFATGDNWTFSLPSLEDDPKPVNVEMTVLGYLQCGAPNAVLLFKPGKNTEDPKEAERTIPFQLNQQFLDIDIKIEPDENVWAVTQIEPYSIKHFGTYNFANLPEHLTKTIESSASSTAFKLDYSEIIRWKDAGVETRQGGVQFKIPQYFHANIDGSLTVSASFTLNEGFIDRSGKNSVGMFIIRDGTQIGQGTDVPGKAVDVTFPAQIAPGEQKQGFYGGIIRGTETHTLEVGLWHADGMGVPPKYGAKYTYKWMPLSEAQNLKPEIKGQ